MGAGAVAITRLPTSSPRRRPADDLDPVPERSRSRASSRAIDARTAESVKISVRTAADAAATAAAVETAEFSCADFTAPYCATLRRAYTRNRKGGGVWAI